MKMTARKFFIKGILPNSLWYKLELIKLIKSDKRQVWHSYQVNNVNPVSIYLCIYKLWL